MTAESPRRHCVLPCAPLREQRQLGRPRVYQLCVGMLVMRARVAHLLPFSCLRRLHGYGGTFGSLMNSLHVFFVSPLNVQGPSEEVRECLPLSPLVLHTLVSFWPQGKIFVCWNWDTFTLGSSALCDQLVADMSVFASCWCLPVKQAQFLRDRYVFLVIPMINVEGVDVPFPPSVVRHICLTNPPHWHTGPSAWQV